MERNFHSEVDLNTRVAPIRRIGGVTGVCVLERGEVLLGQMTLTPDKFDNVVQTLDEMFSDYDVMGHEVDQVNLGFDGSNLVAMAHGDFRLAVLHQRAEDADAVARASRRLLQELCDAEDRAHRIEEAGLTLPPRSAKSSNGASTQKPRKASEPQPMAPPALRRGANGRRRGVGKTTTGGRQRVTLDELKKATDAIDDSEIAWDVAPPPIAPAKGKAEQPVKAKAKTVVTGLTATEMNWIEFRRVLGGVIGKVMSPSAFNYFVQQELGSALHDVHPGRYRELAHVLLEKIPDPVKQRRIRVEVADMFEDLGL